MSMTSVGDTLLVTFDFPEDKLEQYLQNDIWIRVRSEGMELRLPAEVQAVVVDVEDMEANFYGLRCDTLSFRTRYLARLEDCHVTALAAQAQSLHLNSGTVRNLYLNLDEIADWDVNTGSSISIRSICPAVAIIVVFCRRMNAAGCSGHR